MRLVAVLIGLSLLSCGTLHRADFSKRKYLDLPKFSKDKSESYELTNSGVNFSDVQMKEDLLQEQEKVETDYFDEDTSVSDSHLEFNPQQIEMNELQHDLKRKQNSSIVPATKGEINKVNQSDPDPDPANFHKRFNFSFWLLLAGLVAAIVSVPVLFGSSGVLYIILVLIAAFGLIVGWILSLKNIRSAKEIPDADKTGWFNFKLGFAWFVAVVGMLILGLLAILLVGSLL